MAYTAHTWVTSDALNTNNFNLYIGENFAYFKTFKDGIEAAVTVAGVNTTLNGALIVTNAATFNGAATVTGLLTANNFASTLVNIDGGAIDNAVIGGATPAAGTFTAIVGTTGTFSDQLLVTKTSGDIAQFRYDVSNFLGIAVTVSGNATLAPSGGTLNITGIAAISSNATVGGTLGVTGATTLNSTLTATSDVSSLYRVALTQSVTNSHIIQVAGTLTANSANWNMISTAGTLAGTNTTLAVLRNATTITPSGAITNAIAQYLAPTLAGSQNVTHFYGNRILMTLNTSAGTLTNMYGVYVETPVITAGTVTNKYGHYTEALGATDYVWYSLAGLFRIGGDFIHDTGDMYWTTAGAGLAYGSVIANNNSTATTISVQDTWYKFAGFNAEGDSNLTTPSHANDRVTVTKAGVYRVHLNASIKGATAGKTYEITLQKTGSGTALTRFYAVYYATDTNYQSIAINGTISLAASDYLEVFIRCTDATTADATISYANLGVFMIGA